MKCWMSPNTLRDSIANFDDEWRPLRAYFYWDKHCFDIPVCWSIRSLFDALERLDQITEKFTYLRTTYLNWTLCCRRCWRRYRR